MTQFDDRIAALVPMRHTSERVKGKNYRELGGRPLFHHIIEALSACELIGEIAVDTDSDLIAENAAARFPHVRVIPRPAHLLGAEVPMNEILLHDVTCVEADYYVQTHSTNPLLRPATITAALEAFLGQRDRYDSLFTVTPLNVRLWWRDGSPVNHDPDVLLRTQDLPPVMMENSCLYVFDRDTLERRRNRIGERPLLYQLNELEAWDIDDETDWSIVELLLSRQAA
jgi:CMP-N-acetylneuraminic acid synthetase